MLGDQLNVLSVTFVDRFLRQHTFLLQVVHVVFNVGDGARRNMAELTVFFGVFFQLLLPFKYVDLFVVAREPSIPQPLYYNICLTLEHLKKGRFKVMVLYDHLCPVVRVFFGHDKISLNKILSLLQLQFEFSCFLKRLDFIFFL